MKGSNPCQVALGPSGCADCYITATNIYDQYTQRVGIHTLKNDIKSIVGAYVMNLKIKGVNNTKRNA